MFVVGDIIRNNAMQHPDKIGLVHEGNRFTWKETEARVNSFAQGLIKLGLKKGDGVGILLRNCHQWVESALAMAKLGLRMVPLNMMLREHELTYIIDNSETRLLLADANMADMVRGMLSNLPGVDRVIGYHDGHGFDLDYEKIVSENPQNDPFWPVSPEDISMVIYTSGTTGHPKGAMLTHANLAAASVCEGYDYRVIPSHIAMNYLSLFFIGGWGST